MTAQKLDGKAASAAIKDELRARVAALAEKGVVPGIATVLVGAYIVQRRRRSRSNPVHLTPRFETDPQLGLSWL